MMDTELAWAAGIFEGEGSIRINKATGRNKAFLVLDVVNIDVEIIAFFQARWPAYMRQVGSKGQRRAYWRYRCCALVAQRCLNDLLPYFKTARVRERALLALEFQAQKSRDQRINKRADYHAVQADYYDRMAVLNLRGVQPPAA